MKRLLLLVALALAPETYAMATTTTAAASTTPAPISNGMIKVAVVVSGLILYYGYQRTRMEVLPAHRVEGSLSAAMNEPPPIHGGP